MGMFSHSNRAENSTIQYMYIVYIVYYILYNIYYIIYIVYYMGPQWECFSHSNRAWNNTIGHQQNTQIGQLYYNNGQYYSIPATLWITLKSLSHPNKSPYSPTIGVIRIQFAIWCVLSTLYSYIQISALASTRWQS